MPPSPEPEREKEEERKRDKVGKFLKANIAKGELALKHAAGLGPVPNVVPLAPPVLDGPSRAVEVAWHPVGGFAGKWFAEQTGLGKIITEKINKYPDPTQHWAVLVGDYAHQLWMDENFDVIYTNEAVKREEWHMFSVGHTRFNDDAIRRAGEGVIQNIRSRQPAYNLITNNCQTYVLQLLDAIKVGMVKELGTTLAVYEKLTGEGKVMELFVKGDGHNEVEMQAAAAGGDSNTVSFAQQVMNDNTTQLDTQEEVNKHKEEGSRGLEKNDKDGKRNKCGNGGKEGKPLKNFMSSLTSAIPKRLQRG
ncbi:uncharacterized protein DNG_09669 [Cephalotrichum gorgonifer]|uniref:Uncharacterized protein n=1 Tax=Cephalotrichum gorgonifer TaxID=2041049 RepID=A0AAE8SZJ5_9PEZI|nr:uncharacterized protein DNG_09669 [Cephalotrichum gorgonifer]